jgi:hypothetical protein
MADIVCDRCGREMRGWKINGVAGVGGNCTCCGDDLCAACAVNWSEYGECEKCQEVRVDDNTKHD